eukprot:TRINITY_DN3004_c0_g1_i1.p1 TRINITY_DN3004_c0_g1~~TRINITY_DN3004_c0_g1_i1.p1  ORF type:complete len:1384 (-),score=356.52 TRINITY_DN3004_c0_g1_i1:149-3877(-)
MYMEDMLRLKERNAVVHCKNVYLKQEEEKLSLLFNSHYISIIINFGRLFGIDDISVRQLVCLNLESPLIIGYLPSCLLQMGHDTIGRNIVTETIRSINIDYASTFEDLFLSWDSATKTVFFNFTVMLESVSLGIDTENYIIVKQNQLQHKDVARGPYVIVYPKAVSNDFTCTGILEKRFHFFEKRCVEGVKVLQLPNMMDKLHSIYGDDWDLEVDIDYKSFLNISGDRVRNLCLKGFGSQLFLLRFGAVLCDIGNRDDIIKQKIKENIKTVKVIFDSQKPKCELIKEDNGQLCLIDRLSCNKTWELDDLEGLLDDYFMIEDYMYITEMHRRYQGFLSSVDVNIDLNSILAISDIRTRLKLIEMLDSEFVLGYFLKLFNNQLETDYNHLLKLIHKLNILFNFDIPQKNGNYFSANVLSNCSFEISTEFSIEKNSPILIIDLNIYIDENGNINIPEYELKHKIIKTCENRNSQIIANHFYLNLRNLMDNQTPVLIYAENDVFDVSVIEKFVGNLSVDVDSVYDDNSSNNPIDNSILGVISKSLQNLCENNVVCRKEFSTKKDIVIELINGDSINIDSTNIVQSTPKVIKNTSLSKVDLPMQYFSNYQKVMTDEIELREYQSFRRAYFKRLKENREIGETLKIQIGKNVQMEGFRTTFEQIFIAQLLFVEKDIINNIETKYVPKLKQKINSILGLESTVEQFEMLKIQNNYDVIDFDIVIDWSSLFSIESDTDRLIILELLSSDYCLGRLFKTIETFKNMNGLSAEIIRGILLQSFQRINITIIDEEQNTNLVKQTSDGKYIPTSQFRFDGHTSKYVLDDIIIYKPHEKNMIELRNQSLDMDHMLRQSVNLTNISLRTGANGDLRVVNKLHTDDLRRTFDETLFGVQRIKNIVESEKIPALRASLATFVPTAGTSNDMDFLLNLADEHNIVVEVNWTSFDAISEPLHLKYQRLNLAFISNGNILDAVREGMNISSNTNTNASKDNQKIPRSIFIECAPLPGDCYINESLKMLKILCPFSEALHIPSSFEISTIIKQWREENLSSVGDNKARLDVLRTSIKLSQVQNGNVKWLNNLFSQVLFHRSSALPTLETLELVPKGNIVNSVRILALSKLRGSFDAGRVRLLSVELNTSDFIIFRPPPDFSESQRISLKDIHSVIIGPLADNNNYATEIVLRTPLEDSKRLVFSLVDSDNDSELIEAAALELGLLIAVTASNVALFEGLSKVKVYVDQPITRPSKKRLFGLF